MSTRKSTAGNEPERSIGPVIIKDPVNGKLLSINTHTALFYHDGFSFGVRSQVEAYQAAHAYQGSKHTRVDCTPTGWRVSVYRHDSNPGTKLPDLIAALYDVATFAQHNDKTRLAHAESYLEEYDLSEHDRTSLRSLAGTIQKHLDKGDPAR